jgi:competence protein ComEC
MKKLIVIFLSLILFPISVFAEGEDALKVHFIDVGEGDSILIEAPNGKTVLIDAGNLITGFRVVEYLKENDIQNLDYLIFSHHHPDHIGGAFFILQMMNVEEVYDNGDDLIGVAKSSDIYRWYEELVRRDEDYRVLKARDTLSLGEVILEVLWPPQPLPFSDFNANSLVIMFEYGEFRCILTGDLTIPAEKELLRYDIDLEADVLKVGHHGAEDATSEEFLKAVSPDLAVISVNKHNIRGYPSANVLERLQNAGVEICRTDKNGDILLTVRPKGKFKIKHKK